MRPTMIATSVVPQMVLRRSISRIGRRGRISRRSIMMMSYLQSVGDYQHDAELLEDASSQPLYAKQSQLPVLPVPILHETAATFFDSALPLAETQQEVDDLVVACEKFPEQAQFLQERLMRKSRCNQKTSWLQEMWNTKAYLEQRGSNVIHVSYFMRLLHEIEAPPPSSSQEASQEATTTSTTTTATCTTPLIRTQTQRGAAVLHCTARYAATVTSGSKQPDVVGAGGHITLCSSQYKYLFHSSRVPGKTADKYRVYDAASSSHAVVVVAGQFFQVPLIDPRTNTLYSQRVLTKLLDQCLEMTSVHLSHSSNERIPELGCLTTQNRDDWFLDYDYLTRCTTSATEFQKALDVLQSGLVLLCLDGRINIHETVAARNLWLGNVQNRWYDKSLQFVLTTDATNNNLGMIGEHSMADGMVTLELCALLQKELGGSDDDDGEMQPPPQDNNKDDEKNNESMDISDTNLPQPTLIFEQAFQKLTDYERAEIRNRCEVAKTSHETKAERYDISVLRYSRYGSDFIKKRAGCSPDAFVQMAMQAASVRHFKVAVPTYESTQTRRFLHGRTETTRTVSKQSIDFCRAMIVPHSLDGMFYDSPSKMALELLRKACVAHTAYTAKALEGRGIDRHFFGLENCLQLGEKAPDLMEHPLYFRSKRWLMSTSTLPNTMPGFGNVEPRGLGIGYDIQEKHIVFTITGEREYNTIRTFRKRLIDALNEIWQLVVDEEKTGIKSKL